MGKKKKLKQEKVSPVLRDLIKSAMVTQGVTPAELSRRTGVSRAAISQNLSSTSDHSMTFYTATQYLDALNHRIEFKVTPLSVHQTDKGSGKLSPGKEVK